MKSGDLESTAIRLPLLQVPVTEGVSQPPPPGSPKEPLEPRCYWQRHPSSPPYHPRLQSRSALGFVKFRRFVFFFVLVLEIVIFVVVVIVVIVVVIELVVQVFVVFFFV